MGDLNIHYEDISNPDARKFISVLDGFGLSQHIADPTHVKGHTLDVVITRANTTVDNVIVTDPLISDHFCVSYTVDMCKPPFPKKEISYRKMKSIDLEQFKFDIENSRLISAKYSTCDQLVDQAVEGVD